MSTYMFKSTNGKPYLDSCPLKPVPLENSVQDSSNSPHYLNSKNNIFFDQTYVISK
jgi:hypothetical protein